MSALAKFAAKAEKDGLGDVIKKYLNAGKKKVGEVADDIGSAAKERLGEAGEYAKKKSGEAFEAVKANPGKAGAAAGLAAATTGAGFALSGDDDTPKKKKRAYLED